jgi:hypothetical protein
MCPLASEHFGWTQDSSIIVGKTAIGRAAVATLQMNREVLVSMREMWVIFGKHPPDERLESSPQTPTPSHVPPFSRGLGGSSL